MKIDEALEWLNEIIKRSADCDKMSIDDERLEAITVARDVLEAMAPDTNGNFEPWLPNSRNQRCILPLMNLMLKDDGVEGSK